STARAERRNGPGRSREWLLRTGPPPGGRPGPGSRGPGPAWSAPARGLPTAARRDRSVEDLAHLVPAQPPAADLVEGGVNVLAHERAGDGGRLLAGHDHRALLVRLDLGERVLHPEQLSAGRRRIRMARPGCPGGLAGQRPG